MFVRVRFDGRSTRFPIQGSSAMTHGLEKHGRRAARPITGPAWPSTRIAASCSFRRVLPPLTFMALPEPGMICLRILYLHLMQQPEKEYGISRAFITTSGIEIFQRLRSLFP